MKVIKLLIFKNMLFKHKNFIIERNETFYYFSFLNCFPVCIIKKFKYKHILGKNCVIKKNIYVKKLRNYLIVDIFYYKEIKKSKPFHYFLFLKN